MVELKLPKPTQTIEELTTFIQQVYRQTGKAKAVIAVSGGIDSALALTLLVKALGPGDVYPVFLPYADQDMTDAKTIATWLDIPTVNWRVIEIGPAVAQLAKTLLIGKADKLRLGNVMARVRMITVFDLAKKLDALVCGTENKSEHHLGYFTRFGDQASDLEPLVNLYKTQVRQLAQHLALPSELLAKAPSAGLWPDQTDEVELGFSYEEADKVLAQLIDQEIEPEQIKNVDQKIVKQVVNQVNSMAFKHQVPYAQ